MGTTTALDPVTNAALIASITPLAHMVLGDSAKYLGGELKLFTESNVNNIKSILMRGKSKLGEHPTLNRNVSSRLVKDLIFEASFCEDPLIQEYYAGVLSSSKISLDDDIGIAMSKLVSNLSHLQLRFHYAYYFCLQKYFASEPQNEQPLMALQEKGSSMGLSVVMQMLNISNADTSRIENLLNHIFSGLQFAGLTGSTRYGDTSDLYPAYAERDATTIQCAGTSRGIELFLWANGLGHLSPSYFFSKEFNPSDYTQSGLEKIQLKTMDQPIINK